MRRYLIPLAVVLLLLGTLYAAEGPAAPASGPASASAPVRALALHQPQPPVEPPALAKVKAAHPRIYWHDDIPARLAAAPAILTRMLELADSDSAADHVVLERAVCGAALWRVGLPPGQKYKYTRAEYAQRGVAALLDMCKTPINLAGNHYAVNHLHPIAWAYDWLYDALTEEQRSTVRGVLKEALEAGYTPGREEGDGKRRVQNPNLYWAGYNADSGIGMTVALALHGETETDWVRRYWFENWWAMPAPAAQGRGGLWNRQYERDWMPGGGNHEDWGYLGNQITIRAARHAWETATGDTRSLDYSWLNDQSLMQAHQCVALPFGDAKGKGPGTRLWYLQSCCAGGGYPTYRQANWFAAGTGSKDPKTAALSAWLLTQGLYVDPSAGGDFFWRCVVGDPRVKPQSPAELKLAPDYTAEGLGMHWDRAGWGKDDTIVFFGCTPMPVRATAVGDVMIWSQGLPLIAHRNQGYDHSYCGLGRLTLPQIREVQTNKLISARGGDGKSVRVRFASLKQTGDTFEAELSALFPEQVTRYVRTFQYDRAANVVTVTDEAVCKPGFVPTASWATPEKPQLGEAAVTFSNGKASAVMTWSAPPAEVTVRGGETADLWAQDYDGSLYHVEGTATWKKLPREQKILAGGFYTVYVTPKESAGAYRLVTTIKVK